jgi:DNA-binding transcriptional ArsR family regulator
MLKKLDPVIHSETRLTIMSVLIKCKKIDFNHLKELTNMSSGNLSAQTKILKEAGYITIEKEQKDNYSHTIYMLTELGEERFKIYKAAIQNYISWTFGFCL